MMIIKTFSTPVKKESTIFKSCPICSGNNFRKLWDCNNFTFVICKSCGLIQQNPQSLSHEVLTRYDDLYFAYQKLNHEAYRDLELKTLLDLEIINKNNNGLSSKAILDIGCSIGSLMAYFRDLGCHVKGIEVCRPAAEFGIKEYRLDIHIGTIATAELRSESFDIIHASHLIEHLNDLEDFLKRVYSALKKDGVLVLSTPNSQSFQATFFKKNWRSAIFDHLFLFSKTSLRVLLEKNGFRVDKLITWGGWAKGLKPKFIKKPLDFLAKKFNLGDVMGLRIYKK